MPSTVIRRFAWRPGNLADPPALDVEFTTGRVYRYAAVPEEVALAMRGAFSKGSFFNRRIRDAYAHTRLPEWPPDEAPELSWGMLVR
jgi:hypothetical protein